MSIETEVKLRLEDSAGFLARLQVLAPMELTPRHFEDNFALDYADAGLRLHSCLLRLRLTERGALVTYKGPPLEGSAFKVREELETMVQDGTIVLEIFERIGMRIWFRYQKYRREFEVALGSPPAETVHISLDETPIGEYAELEGSEDGIRRVAGMMGFDESQFIRLSYYSLYREYCESKQQELGFMVFASP